MKILPIRFLAFGFVLATAACSSHETAAPASGAKVHGQVAMVSVTFSVEAIDVSHRLITLKNTEGKSARYFVGPEVKRFSEIKVGDSLVVQYHVGVMAELREATAEEKALPIKIEEGVSRAPSEVPPTGALSRTVRVVTTVDAVDKKAQTLSVKGPLGGTLTVKVEDSSALNDLKVGQTIVATFGEQLVLAIEPGSKNQ